MILGVNSSLKSKWKNYFSKLLQFRSRFWPELISTTNKKFIGWHADMQNNSKNDWILPK